MNFGSSVRVLTLAAISGCTAFVCDRESVRIRIFSPDGEYLSEWTDTQRPTHLVVDSLGRACATELAYSSFGAGLATFCLGQE